MANDDGMALDKELLDRSNSLSSGSGCDITDTRTVEYRAGRLTLVNAHAYVSAVSPETELEMLPDRPFPGRDSDATATPPLTGTHDTPYQEHGVEINQLVVSNQR